MVIFISLVSICYLVYISSQICVDIYNSFKKEYNSKKIVNDKEKMDPKLQQEINFLYRKIPYLETTIERMESALV